MVYQNGRVFLHPNRLDITSLDLSTDNPIDSMKDYEILGFKLNIVNLNKINFTHTIAVTLPPILLPQKVAFLLIKLHKTTMSHGE